jgi:hypothetical protein
MTRGAKTIPIGGMYNDQVLLLQRGCELKFRENHPFSKTIHPGLLPPVEFVSDEDWKVQLLIHERSS